MTKKEAILAAATELFAENGYDGTSTAQIAERAGVAHGTVFHHFKAKENLLVEMGETLVRAHVEQVQQLPLAQGTGWDALVLTLRESFRFVEANWQAVIVLMHEMPRVVGREACGVHMEHVNRSIETVRELRREVLRRGQADGSICSCPVEETGFVIESMVTGIIHAQAKGELEVPPGAAEAVIEFCRRSLQP